MKLLVVYGTVEGQTRKIARFMEEVLQDAGHQVSIANAIDEPPSPQAYDAIMIGSSIHMHKYNAALRHYVVEHIDELDKIPGAFFSVCMAVASDIPEEHEEADQIANHFLEVLGWQPIMVTQIAGALKYTQYDFLKRFIMRMISKREGHSTDTSVDHEYTNWDAVKSFALEFVGKASQGDN